MLQIGDREAICVPFGGQILFTDPIGKYFIVYQGVEYTLDLASSVINFNILELPLTIIKGFSAIDFKQDEKLFCI